MFRRQRVAQTGISTTVPRAALLISSAASSELTLLRPSCFGGGVSGTCGTDHIAHIQQFEPSAAPELRYQAAVYFQYHRNGRTSGDSASA